MSRKELWDKAIEEIDDKYIEEAAQTIMKKSGSTIEINSLNAVEVSTVKSESRLKRAMPVVLASAAALAMIIGSGYILHKYDISISTTQDGGDSTTTTDGSFDDHTLNTEDNTPAYTDDKVYEYFYQGAGAKFENYNVNLDFNSDGSPVDNITLRCYTPGLSDPCWEYETGVSAKNIDTKEIKFYGYPLLSGDILYFEYPVEPGEFGDSIVQLYICSPDGIKPMKTNIGMEFEELMLDPVIKTDPAYDYMYLYTAGKTKTVYEIDFDSGTAAQAKLFNLDLSEEYVNYSELSFSAPAENANYPFEGKWTLAFGSKEEKSNALYKNWDFSNISQIAQTEDNWFFRTDDSVLGGYLYVMPKNEAYIYTYTGFDVESKMLCDYSHVLKKYEDSAIVNGNDIERVTGDYTVRLSSDYDNGKAEFILINNTDKSEKIFDAGFVPQKIGNTYPELNFLHTMGGIVIYVTVPYSQDINDIGHNVYLYGFTEGEIYPLGNQNIPHVSFTDEECVGMNGIYEHDIIYTNLVTGSTRKFYYIDYNQRKALSTKYIPDMDAHTGLLGYSALNFTETEYNVSHAIEETWKVILGGDWCSEGFEFNLNADLYAENGEAWFFRNINGLDIGDKVLGMITKDNADILYLYTDYDKSENLMMCNYTYALERKDTNSVQQTVTDLDNFKFVAEFYDDKPIGLSVRNKATGNTIAEYATDIYQNTVGGSETMCSTLNFEDDIAGVISVPELTEQGVFYRNYFFKVDENGIIPFTDPSGKEYQAITKETGKNVFYKEKCYYEAEVSKTLGNEKVFFCFDFDNVTVTEKQLFPADSDTTPIDYNNLKFTLIENGDPFIGKWEFAHETITSVPVVINTSGAVAYTDKAWYYSENYGGEIQFSCIYYDDPDCMYTYGFYSAPSVLHSDYSLVYKRCSLEKLTEEFVSTYASENRAFTAKLGYTQGLTTKLNRIILENNGEAVAEIPVDIKYKPEATIKPHFESICFKDGTILILYVPEDNFNYTLHIYQCKPYSGYLKKLDTYDMNGNATDILHAATGIPENNYEGNTIICHSIPQNEEGTVVYGGEYKKYRVDFEENTAREIYIYPVEGDSSKMPELSSEMDLDIIENVFYGQWKLVHDKQGDDVNPGSTQIFSDTLDFSYVGGMNRYPHYSLADSASENDKGWFTTGRNSICNTVCYIPKDDPDMLYYYISQDTTMNDYAAAFKRVENTSAVDTITVPAALTHLGIEKLENQTGYDILNPPESVSYEKAKKWVMGEIGSIGIGEVFLTSLSENKITYCRRACPADANEMIYPDGYVIEVPNYDAFVYLTFTAEKTNGEWKITSVAADNSSKLHVLVHELQASKTGLYENVIGYILQNYLSPEFWDENINPQKQRITADAIRKLNNHIADEAEKDKELTQLLINDREFIYTACFNTYWQ